MLTLSPINDDQVLHVLLNISPEDAAELTAAGLEPMESFLSGISKSVIVGLVIKDDAEPVALFGCVPDTRQPNTGIPWMVATPEFRKHPRDGMALSRQVVGQMQEKFNHLHNLVHNEHWTVIRWLSWCGFTLELETPQGPNDAFFYFHWSR